MDIQDRIEELELQISWMEEDLRDMYEELKELKETLYD